MNVSKDLATLYGRDLARLLQQIEAFPDDQTVWKTLPGVMNSAGNLTLHLEGNLREYIGRQLGGHPYSRRRELEFSSTGVPRGELGRRIAELGVLIPSVVEALSSEQLDMTFPQVVLERATSTREFLIHLYGHLNWHLGEIDYLRRILIGEGAFVVGGK